MKLPIIKIPHIFVYVRYRTTITLHLVYTCTVDSTSRYCALLLLAVPAAEGITRGGWALPLPNVQEGRLLNFRKRRAGKKSKQSVLAS